MKALRTHQPGGPESLVFEDAPVPDPPTGEVLIEVRGCGFTPNELEWSATWVDRAGRSRTPSIPCQEVSGVVRDVGFGTSGLDIGRHGLIADGRVVVNARVGMGPIRSVPGHR